MKSVPVRFSLSALAELDKINPEFAKKIREREAAEGIDETCQTFEERMEELRMEKIRIDERFQNRLKEIDAQLNKSLDEIEKKRQKIHSERCVLDKIYTTVCAVSAIVAVRRLFR